MREHSIKGQIVVNNIETIFNIKNCQDNNSIQSIISNYINHKKFQNKMKLNQKNDYLNFLHYQVKSKMKKMIKLRIFKCLMVNKLMIVIHINKI